MKYSSFAWVVAAMAGTGIGGSLVAQETNSSLPAELGAATALGVFSAYVVVGARYLKTILDEHRSDAIKSREAYVKQIEETNKAWVEESASSRKQFLESLENHRDACERARKEDREFVVQNLAEDHP